MAKGLKDNLLYVILLGVIGFAGSLFLLAAVMVLLSALGIVTF